MRSTCALPRLSVLLVSCALHAGCKDKLAPEQTSEAAVAPAPTSMAADKPAVKFGVLPAVSAKDVTQDYASLMAALGQALGRSVELVVAKNYKTLADDLIFERVHLAQLSAHMYLRVKAGTEAHAIVQQRMASETPYRGVFVVHKGSKAKSLKALKGKGFAYVNRDSASGYYYPRMRMRALGLHPDQHFNKTVLAGSHALVIEIIKAGKVAGGCISEQSVSEAPWLRVIDTTEPIPDDAIVSAAGFSAAERKAVADFFKTAHDNPDLQLFMNRRGIGKYVEPDLSVYKGLEEEMGLSLGDL